MFHLLYAQYKFNKYIEDTCKHTHTLFLEDNQYIPISQHTYISTIAVQDFEEQQILKIEYWHICKNCPQNVMLVTRWTEMVTDNKTGFSHSSS